MAHLKDHNQKEKKQVTDNLQQENFDWGYNSFHYTRGSTTVDVEVIMSEQGSTAENSRIFQITCPKKLDEASINKELLKLDAFEGSKPK